MYLKITNTLPKDNINFVRKAYCSDESELRYSEDQPRDELGRWTSTGGSSADLTEGEKNDKINGKLRTIVEMLEKLAEHSPKQWKQIMIAENREVTPLSSGRLKGISFENGGGYKTNFEDGGVFMYHPEFRSHHGSDYYKISTGKKGTNRYDRNGKRIDKPKSRT